MSRVSNISVACTFVFALLLGVAYAADEPKPCKDLKQAENLNITLFLGDWYEINRTDYDKSPTINGHCVKQNYQVLDSKYIINTSVKYIIDGKTDTSYATNGSVEAKDGSLNVTYLDQQSLQVKIIETDHTNYAVVCGYLNDSSDAGAWVLYRERTLKNDHLSTILNATKLCSDFSRAIPIEQGNICNHSAIAIPAAMILVFVSFYNILRNIF